MFFKINPPHDHPESIVYKIQEFFKTRGTRQLLEDKSWSEIESKKSKLSPKFQFSS